MLQGHFTVLKYIMLFIIFYLSSSFCFIVVFNVLFLGFILEHLHVQFFEGNTRPKLFFAIKTQKQTNTLNRVLDV